MRKRCIRTIPGPNLNNRLAELGALAAQFSVTLDPATKAQLERCQEALRRFGQIRIALPDVAPPNTDLQTEYAELRAKYDREPNLHTQFCKHFDEEIEIRKGLQLQLEDAKTTAAAEAMWANRNEALLDEMPVLMTCLATQPITGMPLAATPHALKTKPTRPDPYNGGCETRRQQLLRNSNSPGKESAICALLR